MRTASALCLALTAALLIACGARPPSTTTAAGEGTKGGDDPPRGKTAEVGGVRMTAGEGGWVDNNFETAMYLKVEIDNRTEGKRLRFSSWRRCRLRDQFGTEYACHGSATELHQPRTFADMALDPGQKQTESLHFETPTDKARSFDLDIPGACVGTDGTFRLHFDRPPPPKK